MKNRQLLNYLHYQYIYCIYYKLLCLQYLQNLSSVFCHPTSVIADYPTLTDEIFTYDANGSQIEEKNASGQLEKQYLYNTENRLAEIKDGSGVNIATYYYDPFGRRLSKTITNPDATTTTTYFHYNDEGYSAEKTNGQITSYLFSPQNTWSTSPILKRENNTYYYYQNDHLGTPNILHDKQGQVVNAREMKAFGEWSNSTDIINSNFAFAGQYRDAETSTYYNFHRDYHPGLGRYIKSDPIGLDDGANIFIYVKASPLNYIDETGLNCKYGGICPKPQPPPECKYYSKKCTETGCGYYCWAAPTACNFGELLPLFWGANLNCIRKCLVEEDDKSWNDESNIDCDGCMNLDVIDKYHVNFFLDCDTNLCRSLGTKLTFPCLKY